LNQQLHATTPREIATFLYRALWTTDSGADTDTNAGHLTQITASPNGDAHSWA